MVSLNDYMLQCIYAAHDTAENIYDIIKKSLKLDFIVAWSRAAYENQTMKQKNIDCECQSTYTVPSRVFEK